MLASKFSTQNLKQQKQGFTYGTFKETEEIVKKAGYT